MKKINRNEENIYDYKYTDWWDKLGSFKPLHKFNSTRIDYILKIIKRKKLYSYENFLKGLSILDVGCGRGLFLLHLARKVRLLEGGRGTGVDVWPHGTSSWALEIGLPVPFAAT